MRSSRRETGGDDGFGFVAGEAVLAAPVVAGPVKDRDGATESISDLCSPLKGPTGQWSAYRHRILSSWIALADD